MQNQVKILVGATSSGCGKTTFTLGLLRALANRGLSVQAFKCGPDYIDTQYHALASKSGFSVNLDTFLSSSNHVKYLFDKYSKTDGKPVDACVIEGVMGLFDGYSKMDGSSAQIAEILDIPVLLIINAKASSYSVAPILYGYKNFYKGIRIAGVVFNMVGSEHHYSMLKQACSDVGIPALGYIPKNEEIAIPSRHLGLTLEEKFSLSSFTQKISELIEKHVDIDRILEIYNSTLLYSNSCIKENLSGRKDEKKMKIAVACDEAFNFTYKENLEQLAALGEVCYFSPMRDEHLPCADLLYLPGGYPELFAKDLSSNISMLEQIKEYAENGGRILAECGGMIYLCNYLNCGTCNEQEQSLAGLYKMVGIFPMNITMEGMRLQMGYRTFEYGGLCFRGHEFHYSRVEEGSDSMVSETDFYSAGGKKTATKLYRYKNVIAGYTHIYWGELCKDKILSIFADKC